MIDLFAKQMNIKQQKCYKLLDKSLENGFVRNPTQII